MPDPNAAPDPAAIGADLAKTMPPVTGGSSAPAGASRAPSATATPSPTSPEVDAAGVPFDAAKHLPKKGPKGRWMPKSPGRFGRDGAKRPQPSSPAATGDLFSSPPSSPGASASSASGGSPSGGGGSYIPPETDLPPPPTSEARTPGDSAPEGDGEPVAGADDVAEVGCFILYGVTGFATGAPDEAEPPAKEHARLRNIFAAYLKSKGVETRGGWAVALAVVGWALRVFSKPKSRAWAEEKLGRRRAEPRPVEPIPVDPAPAAEPARPSAPRDSSSAPAAGGVTRHASPGSYVINLPR